ncbi:MAG: molybdopterin dinucleotide binding domain-containing protein [candidate division WOR-3 bacterium]
MITQDSKLTIKRTLCPFCGYGCELGIVFDDFGIKGVEYLKDTPNQGRICPRGSAAPVYLNHPKRLCVPVREDKYTEWESIKSELAEILKEPETVAITLDRNLTIEEEVRVIGFAHRYGIKNIVSAYLEPESGLRYFIDRQSWASIEEIGKSDMIIVVGDVFNYTPMISRDLINWRLADRKHRLVVVDSLRSHTAYFATDFLRVHPGTEGILLLRLAGEKMPGFNIEEICGVSERTLDDIAQVFKTTENSLLILTLPFARSYEPQLILEGARRLSSANKKILPIFEFTPHFQLPPFGKIWNAVKDNKIKYLITFGELFPFYYPQITNGLGQIKAYATSTLRFKKYTQLPMALNIEKSGTIITIGGERQLGGEIVPASGAQTIETLFKRCGLESSEGQLPGCELKFDVKEGIQRLKDRVQKRNLTLFGEKIAFHYMGLWEKPVLKLNPFDARELGVKENEPVVIESIMGKAKLQVKIMSEVPRGTVFTQPETPEVRGLFAYELVGDFVNFIPTEVQIWPVE